MMVSILDNIKYFIYSLIVALMGKLASLIDWFTTEQAGILFENFTYLVAIAIGVITLYKMRKEFIMKKSESENQGEIDALEKARLQQEIEMNRQKLDKIKGDEK